MNLKTSIYRFLGVTCWPLAHRLRNGAQDDLAIIMMHGVHTPVIASSSPPPSSSMLIEDFETNVRALTRRYKIISMDEAVEILAGRARRHKCVVLTFDDSFKCLVDIAAPLLANLGLTATFYVSTEVIDTQKPYWWLRLEYAVAHAKRSRTEIKLPSGRLLLLETGHARGTVQEIKAVLRCTGHQEREQILDAIESGCGVSLLDGGIDYLYADVMNWDDVRRLGTLGMTIGSHTVTHPNLSLLTPDALYMELRESKMRIEAACQDPCRHLCYPYGSYSDAVAEAARACGYASAVTTQSPGWNGHDTDIFRLRRFAMPWQAYKLSYLLAGYGEMVVKGKRVLKIP